MDQSLQMVPEQAQTMRVSPTLIMVNQLLALSSQELQQMVRAELEANPALEGIEKATCASCGAGTNGRYCPVCMQAITPAAQSARPQAEENAGSGIAEDYYDYSDFQPGFTSNASAYEDEFDPLTAVAYETDLVEQLLMDLAASLPQEEYLIAEYLVGNLDDQGFMSCSAKTAANDLEAPVEQVERVLEVLQRTGPPGVGARDLRECLLIQLEEIKAAGHPKIAPHTEEIISDHLTALGEHKYTIIAQQLGAGYEDVVAVRDFIKQHLQPRPIQESPQGHAWRSPSPTRFVSPDVIIHLRDGKLEPEVVEGYRFSLQINPLYQQLAMRANKQAGAMSEQEREHIKRYVNRSKLFISNIQQRRDTMRRITECLITIQEDYILHGVRRLKPLTRAQLAQYIGIHESTVSRATADKYVMLPNKQVIPFSDFFSASLSVKDVIKEIITKEAHPVTDKEIVNRLQEQGIRVARRTVTKYRNQLRILPSTLR